MHFTYPATIKDDGEGNLLVTFRDIPFTATEGKTVDKAQDCLETAILLASKTKTSLNLPNSKIPNSKKEIIP